MAFDSAYYQDVYDKSFSAVKGLVFPLDYRNRPQNVYIGILFDDRVRTSDYRFDQKDQAGNPFYRISQSEFERSENPMGEYEYDFGVPVYLTYTNDIRETISYTISPKQIVRVFEIAHGIGNFYEGHQYRMPTGVQLSPIAMNSKVRTLFKEFRNDNLQNFILTFNFPDNVTETYYCARLSSGIYTLFSSAFIQNRYTLSSGTKTTFSPVIKAESDANYTVENLSDGNLMTAWSPVDKAGGWVLWKFDSKSTFAKIVIANGYQRVSSKGTDLFKANSRVKQIRLTNDRNEILELTLEDANSTKAYELADSTILKSITSLKLEILSVYPGTKYQDVLLSEVSFQ